MRRGDGDGHARNIELYNQAFQLARDHIAKDPELNDKAGIVKHLHEAIRQELLGGVVDPVSIAAGAVRKLQAQGVKR